MAISAGNFQNALLNLGDTAKTSADFIPYANFLSQYGGQLQPDRSIEGQITYRIPGTSLTAIPKYDENGQLTGYASNAGTIVGSGEAVPLQYDAQGNLISATPTEKASGAFFDRNMLGMLAAGAGLAFGLPMLGELGAPAWTSGFDLAGGGALGNAAGGTALSDLATANAISQTAGSMTSLTSIGEIASAAPASDVGAGLFGNAAMDAGTGLSTTVPSGWGTAGLANAGTAAGTAATSGSLLNSLFGGGSSWYAPLSIGANLLGSYMQSSAAQDAAAAQMAAAAQNTQLQRDIFNTINQQQARYRQAGYGALSRLSELLPSLTTAPTEQDLMNMPGTQFAINQGVGAARQGMNALSPGANVNRAATKFAEDYALTQAYPQYLNTQTGIYNRLAGIAGIGQTGQTATNVAGTNFANTAGQLGIGSATAYGTGQVGSANAYANAGQNTLNQLLLSKYLA